MPDALSVRETQDLLDAARAVGEHAHAPYSRFAVGAAVLTAEGDIQAGCNVENASYGATVCAERVALFNAVSGGAVEIRALAVVTPLTDPTPPCGACRQVMAELAPHAVVVMAGVSGEVAVSTVRELLPGAFRLPPIR